jgi:metal-responsive CopG/Arc/MetJ family transcriptional regulator
MKAKRKGVTTVQIRPAIAALLVQMTKGGATKTEIINEALRQYLIEKELQNLRQKLLPYAQTKGIYSHEDLEKYLES